MMMAQSSFLLLLLIFIAASHQESRLCSDGRFRCPSNGRCLDDAQVCDKYRRRHCPNGEDESWQYARCLTQAPSRRQCFSDRNPLKASAMGVTCRKKLCLVTTDCKGQKTCSCDGLCGPSCFNTDATCEDAPPAVANSTGYKIYRFQPSPTVPTGKVLRPLEDGQTAVYGDIVQYACPAGRRVHGHDVMCGSKRQWSTPAVHCILACDRDQEAADKFGMVCNQACLTDDDCSTDGEVCLCDGPCGRSCASKNVDCGAAPVVANADSVSEKEGIEKTLYYTCREGFYRKSGEISKSCSAKGTWFGKDIECEAFYCPSPLTSIQSSGGTMTSQDNLAEKFPVGSVVEFQCPEDTHTLIGSVERTCLPNGVWSGELTRCDQKGSSNDDELRCKDPGHPIMGRRTGDDFRKNSFVLFTCDDGYVLEGSARQKCDWNLQWDGDRAPKCHDTKYKREEAVFQIVNGMTNLEVAPPTAGRFIEEGRDHEIHFIIDSSKSITEKEYEISIRFAKNLVERMKKYDGQVIYAVIAYASDTKVEFGENKEGDEDRSSEEQVLNVLNNLSKKLQTNREEIKSGTAIGKALTQSSRLFVNKYHQDEHEIGNQHYPGMQRHVFLFSDGKNNEGVEPLVVKEDMVKTYGGNENMQFYSITSCNECRNGNDDESREGYDQLKLLASGDDNFVFTDNMYKLDQAVNMVTSQRIDYSGCGPIPVKGSIFTGNSAGKIFGGKEAKAAVPWQVAIAEWDTRGVKETFQTVIGGGSVISTGWVLSAAHVFRDLPLGSEKDETTMENWVFAAGAFELPKAKDYRVSGSIRMFRAKEIIKHEKYEHGGNFDYDFVLIRVGKAMTTVVRNGKSYISIMEEGEEGYFDGELPYSAYLRSICLPCSGFVTKAMLTDKDGVSLVNDGMTEEELCRVEGEWLLGRHAAPDTTEVWVTGFGVVNATKRRTPRQLQKTALKIEQRGRCDNGVVRMRESGDVKVADAASTDQMFCTGPPPGPDGRPWTKGDPVTDVCKGDSGGPFVRKITNPATGEDRVVQVGVVSWGMSCDKLIDPFGNYYPGFQADVTKVIPWINDNTEEPNDDVAAEEED